MGIPRSSGGRGDDDGFWTIGALGSVLTSRRDGTDPALES
jgi:hypothetical protein